MRLYAIKPDVWLEQDIKTYIVSQPVDVVRLVAQHYLTLANVAQEFSCGLDVRGSGRCDGLTSPVGRHHRSIHIGSCQS